MRLISFKNVRSFLLTALCAIFALPAGANARSEMDEIVAAFLKADVKSLRNEKLHPDTDNKDLVKLGQLLFFDKILSGNQDISCAACHFPTKGTSDGLPIPIGTGGQGLGLNRQLATGHFIPRNAPTAFNMGFSGFHTTMWDARIAAKLNVVTGTMELATPEPAINGPKPMEPDLCRQINSVAAAQALFPVTSNHEMRGEKGENDIADAPTNLEVWKLLTARVIGKNNGSVGGIPKYRKLFKAAYPETSSYDEFNFGHVARAIAAYEMSAFAANNSKLDEFLEGDKSALTQSQFRGAKVFVKNGRCLECHSGSHLTDFKSYSSGMPQVGPGKHPLPGEAIGEDLGLEGMSGDKQDRYKFKVPSLRNVYYSGPWSHSGAYNDLKAFLRHHVDAENGMKAYLAKPSDYLPSPTKTAIDFTKMVESDPRQKFGTCPERRSDFAIYQVEAD